MHVQISGENIAPMVIPLMRDDSIDDNDRSSDTLEVHQVQHCRDKECLRKHASRTQLTNREKERIHTE